LRRGLAGERRNAQQVGAFHSTSAWLGSPSFLSNHRGTLWYPGRASFLLRSACRKHFQEIRGPQNPRRQAGTGRLHSG
jgi:hypothetical protein